MARGTNTSANGSNLLFGTRQSRAIEQTREFGVLSAEETLWFLQKIQKASGLNAMNIQPENHGDTPAASVGFQEIEDYVRYQEIVIERQQHSKGTKISVEGSDFFATFNEQGVFQSFDDQPAYKTKQRPKHIYSRYWFEDGKIHRSQGGPSVVHDQDQYWHKHGKLHRLGQPAMVIRDHIGQRQYWYQEDVHHRTDGPATRIVAKTYVEEEWIVDGKRHREDGPAWTRSDGWEKWFQNDLLHRLDGPAIAFKDQKQEWYARGKRHNNNGPSIEIRYEPKVWHWKGKACKDEADYLAKRAKGRPVT